MDLCVVIDDEACSPPTPSITSNRQMTKHAPNRVINYDELKELIEPELIIYSIYKCNNRKLMEGDVNGLSRNMRRLSLSKCIL